MPISQAPLRSPNVETSDDKFWFFPSNWGIWLQSVWEALKGWRTTKYFRFEDGVTALALPANGSLAVNYTVPGARLLLDGVHVMYNGNLGDGVTFHGRIDASNSVELRFHNYSTSVKNITVGTVDLILFQQ
jgi:hypothetical protein